MSLFDDLKTYVEFTNDDVALLAALAPIVAPHIPRLADHFYDRILAHPKAHASITGGSAQVERLKGTLRTWISSGLVGPHDEAFLERRSRIGRIHVRIDLPQRYMLTAMNVLRVDLHAIVESSIADPVLRRKTSDAVDRLYDMELAIMLETYKEDSELRLRRRERLATIGQIAATIGHELRNPLGVIESSLFLLRRKVGDEPAVARHLDKIANQVSLSGQIVTDLLELTRDSAPRTESAQVRVLIESALAELRVPANITVRAVIAPELAVEANPSLLRRALVNVLSNSFRATGESGGTIVVEAIDGGHEIEIHVKDSGPGFDAEILADAFEPLVTKSEGGVGLGLALVRRVLERHGGRATVANRPDGGAVVKLVLPRSKT
ncbi:MAG: histidine kinase [Deltaproteobacteria bacterium]|nr:histidine kinase [Deltaproteobacteria bacterium]